MYDEIVGNREELSKENFDLFQDNVKISYEEYEDALEKMNYNNYNHIIQLPPNTNLILPNPIIYDLTFQKFQYPNLENKINKQGKGGMFSRAVGYFFKK